MAMKAISISLIALVVVMVVITIAEMGRIHVLETSVLNLQKSLSSIQNSVGNLASTTRSQSSTISQLVSRPAVVQQIVQNDTKTDEQSITSVVAKVSPAVVSIVISKAVPQLEVVYVDPFGGNSAFGDSGMRIPVYRQKGTAVQKVGAGTGFLVSSNGYIVTNKHVVADTQASYTVLLSNGTQQTAQVVYRDTTNDMAVVKISGTYNSYLTLGNSAGLSLGQSVIAIGNALGEYSNSISQGIVSGLNRTIQAVDQATGQTEDLTGVIQTDAAINSGNSGGPLLDRNGQVVGINVATIAGTNSIGFAIPINAVKGTIQSMIR